MTFNSIKIDTIWEHKDGGQYRIIDKKTQMIGSYNFGLIIYVPIKEGAYIISPSDVYMRTFDHFINSFQEWKEPLPPITADELQKGMEKIAESIGNDFVKSIKKIDKKAKKEDTAMTEFILLVSSLKRMIDGGEKALTVGEASKLLQNFMKQKNFNNLDVVNATSKAKEVQEELLKEKGNKYSINIHDGPILALSEEAEDNLQKIENELQEEYEEMTEPVQEDKHTEAYQAIVDDVQDECPAPPPQKIFLSLAYMIEQFRKNVKPVILKEIENGVKFDTIVCITRGGLVPAGVVAYELGIKNIINIKATSYTDDNKQEKLGLKSFSKRDIKQLRKAKGVLIIDDIIDTGVTMRAVCDYVINIIGAEEAKKKVAPLSMVNKQEEFKKYFNAINLVGDERWIVFEWDNI